MNVITGIAAISGSCSRSARWTAPARVVASPRERIMKIGPFHGAYWAGAGDFDADGDTDVFASRG